MRAFTAVTRTEKAPVLLGMLCLACLTRTALIPQSGLETLRHAPVHDSLHQAQPLAQVRKLRVVGMRGEVIIDALDARPIVLFLRRAERSDFVGLFDLIDP